MNQEELLQLIDQAAEDGREKLDLEKKGLTELPEEIGKLKNLTELYLAFNQISKIPNAIANLTNLTGLYLDHNQISEIPSAITKLKNLTELYLNNNQISKIPNAISELKKLEIINLSNNQIREIPEAIVQLENLETDEDRMIEGIDIKGNPIINPPYEIAEKGINAIRIYFLNQQLSRYKDNNTMIKTASIRDKIFVSYSHKDSKWLKEFQTHIKPFVRADGFEIWDDTKIKSGSAWLEEIEKALASAKVAVLLVSPHFIASDFIHNKELPPLFDAAEKEGLTIFWIPIRYSAYAATKIEKYQSAHPPDKPIVSLNTSKRDEAWVNLCKKIAKRMTQSD
ncbi:MAG: leucine-rich repeat domain-containing protein [Snowella sp.]|nr:leucine-rich repeat domain-containing protein [Snowella sp.]